MSQSRYSIYPSARVRDRAIRLLKEAGNTLGGQVVVADLFVDYFGRVRLPAGLTTDHPDAAQYLTDQGLSPVHLSPAPSA